MTEWFGRNWRWWAIWWSVVGTIFAIWPGLVIISAKFAAGDMLAFLVVLGAGFFGVMWGLLKWL